MSTFNLLIPISDGIITNGYQSLTSGSTVLPYDPIGGSGRLYANNSIRFYGYVSTSSDWSQPFNPANMGYTFENTFTYDWSTVGALAIQSNGTDTGYRLSMQMATQSGNINAYRLILNHKDTPAIARELYGQQSSTYVPDNPLVSTNMSIVDNGTAWRWWETAHPRNASDTLYFGCTWTIKPAEYLAYLEDYLAIDNLNFEETEFSPDYGTPSTEEGYGVGGQYGTFDDSSDTISIPTAPAVGMTSTGFVNVYEISQNALTQFGSELFPDLSFTPVSQLPAPTDVTTALENIATVLTDFGNQIPNMIDMYINNTLINYILDCHILPVAPQSSGTSNIKVGFRTFTPLVNVVTSDYVDFDCGSLNIGEYYGNFIDYAPYTTAKLFLPFVGFIEVLPEFWQAGTLSITYRFNIIDGSFMVFIKSTSSKSKLSDTVIAQYGGNVCVHIPITGANYSNMITGLVGAVGGVATHGAGASSIVGGMASALNTVATQSGMQSSNSYNSSTAFLGIRTPYLLIERTVADFSETYDSEHGLPSNISTSFSSLSGFTSSSTVHLDGITGATAEELDELSALLAGGIIL